MLWNYKVLHICKALALSLHRHSTKQGRGNWWRFVPPDEKNSFATEKGPRETRSSRNIWLLNPNMRPQTNSYTSKCEEKNSIIFGNTNHKWTETAQPQQADSHRPRKSYQDFISLLQRKIFGPGSFQLKPLINEEWNGLKCGWKGSTSV